MSITTVDAIILILATSISGALIVSVVAPIILKQEFNEKRSRNVTAVTMAIIAIISLYVGAKLNAI